MARKRNGWVPVGEVFGGLDGPVKAHGDTSPQARHHFTQADQVNHLATANEADPDLGFMARLMALCSLPRTNPGNRLQYKRTNGPYTVLVQTGKRIGDNGIWRIAKLNGILYLLDVGSKTTSFSSAFAGIFASN